MKNNWKFYSKELEFLFKEIYPQIKQNPKNGIEKYIININLICLMHLKKKWNYNLKKKLN